MRLLLDTHAVIWWFLDSQSLSRTAYRAIETGENEVFVSAVSGFEIALKHHLGKLPQAAALAERFETMAAEQDFKPLAISVGHGLAAGRLPIAHRDPFDRLLIAQALVEGMPLVSNERVFDASGVRRLW